MEKGYSLRQTAEALGIKTSTARRWVSKGKIKGKKIPNTKRWLILESEIKRLQGGE